MERIRITYTKTDALRYTSNLDIHKIWERTLRRARLPLAYSQGFHPQPRINQACPLPLGVISWDERVDIWLDGEPIPAEEIKSALNQTVQPGIDVLKAEKVELSEPSLPTQVTAAEYRVTLLGEMPCSFDELQERLRLLLSAEKLMRSRRGKVYDLRPLMEDIRLVEPAPDGAPIQIEMRLSARQSATGRADEVLDALGLDPFKARIERTRLIMEPAS